MKSMLIDLIHFPESHTGFAIQSLIEKAISEKLDIDCNSFTLHFTTDSASNMKKAFKNHNWSPCLNHRLHTIVETSVKAARSINDDLNYFFRSTNELASHLSFKNNIQRQLPIKVTTGPATRAWTAHYDMLNSINKSFDKLLKLLPAYTDKINRSILQDALNFFSMIKFAFFKNGEKNEPSFYLGPLINQKLKKLCDSSPGDSEAMRDLKFCFKIELESKLFTSINLFHYVALLLHPNYKVIQSSVFNYFTHIYIFFRIFF